MTLGERWMNKNSIKNTPRWISVFYAPASWILYFQGNWIRFWYYFWLRIHISSFCSGFASLPGLSFTTFLGKLQLSRTEIFIRSFFNFRLYLANFNLNFHQRESSSKTESHGFYSSHTEMYALNTECTLFHPSLSDELTVWSEAHWHCLSSATETRNCIRRIQPLVQSKKKSDFSRCSSSFHETTELLPLPNFVFGEQNSWRGN